MDMADIAADPHYAARRAIVEVDGTPMQGLIARLSATPGAVRWAGPPARRRRRRRSAPTAGAEPPRSGARSVCLGADRLGDPGRVAPRIVSSGRGCVGGSDLVGSRRHSVSWVSSPPRPSLSFILSIEVARPCPSRSPAVSLTESGIFSPTLSTRSPVLLGLTSSATSLALSAMSSATSFLRDALAR